MSRSASVLLAGAAVLVAAPAFAADLPAPVPSAPAPAPVVITPAAPAVFDWSGLYVGANIGYGFGGSDVVALTTGGGTTPALGELELNGLFGGVQAGFNWQFGAFVAGVETDFQLADIDDSFDLGVAAPGGPVAAVAAPAGTITGNIDWFGTVRARLGYALDRTLIYATGGLAYGHYEVTFATPAAVGSDEQTMVGWTAGAGVEHAFTDNISAKLEYLYVDLGAETFDLTFPAPAPTTTTAGSANFHSVRLGINYRF